MNFLRLVETVNFDIKIVLICDHMQKLEPKLRAAAGLGRIIRTGIQFIWPMAGRTSRTYALSSGKAIEG
jgi:hypothetical protein